MLVILATHEAEIRSITVLSQQGQKVIEALFCKIPPQKKSGEVAQGVGPEFKPQYHKNKTKQKPSDKYSSCFSEVYNLVRKLRHSQEKTITEK
jgi:hypothetical protein